ncbi:hypothetical protein R1sor_014174 [Riccia sorocarpa]|uniref:Histone-lysine N-methyltransferase n=1 Tax=Riccia sorocarpa TaxID=122646 RepID=A0ABD3HBU3_9MARC
MKRITRQESCVGAVLWTKAAVAAAKLRGMKLGVIDVKEERIMTGHPIGKDAETDKTYLQTNQRAHDGRSTRITTVGLQLWNCQHLEKELRSYYGTPCSEKGRHYPDSGQKAGIDLKIGVEIKCHTVSWENFDKDLSYLLVMASGYSNELLNPSTVGSDAKFSSDWLDLSLKGPAKPTPKTAGISGEDLRLCLHPTLPSAPAFCEAGDRKIVVELGGPNDEASPAVSSCRGAFDASLCSTSYFSVQAGFACCSGSPSGSCSQLEVSYCGKILCREETISKQQILTSPPSSYSDPYLGSSGSPLGDANKTREERCDYPPNKLISAGEGNAKMVAVANTHLPADSPLEEVALSCKGGLASENARTGPAGIHKSVGVIELSNSLSADENDGERLNASTANKEVNSVECFPFVRQRTGISMARDTSVKPGEPSPQAGAANSCRFVKAGNPVVVELSDSSTEEEDDEECAGVTPTQPAVPPAISQLTQPTDKRKSFQRLGVKEQAPKFSGSPRDNPTGRISRPTTSKAALEEKVTGMADDSSDLDHATDMFIQKVHTWLNHARPNSLKPATRLNCRSTPKETPAEEVRSKDMSKAEDLSNSRLGKVEVVELSDSSSESESEAVAVPSESDSDIELPGSNRHCSHVSQRTFTPPEARNKTQETDELVNDHPTQYLNEDVVCCSIKPPLKRARVNSGEGEQNRVSYMHDKHGNLVQVVDIDDSDSEGDFGELDAKSSDGCNGDGLLSREPQVQPVIEEIKDMLDVDDNLSVDKSAEADAETRSSSPPALRRRQSARSQSISQSISREPSKRKKSRKLVMEESDSQESDGEKEAAADSKTAVPILRGKQREKWKRGIICDLCSLGPSIALGEWYCWCCGMAAVSCECPEEKKMRKQLSLGYRKGQKLKKRGKQILRHQWSGKVHKMCALWSSEASLEALEASMPQDLVLLKGLAGGQRAARAFLHKVVNGGAEGGGGASLLKELVKEVSPLKEVVEEGVKKPLPPPPAFPSLSREAAVPLKEVYVQQGPTKRPCFAQLDTAVKRGNTLLCRHPTCKKTGATLGCRVRSCRRSYHYPCAENLANQCMLRMWDGVLIPVACQYHRHVEDQAERARERMLRSKITDPVRDGKTIVPAERPYIGKKLLCRDIAEGQEQVQIPCTNDVDDEPVPRIWYITKCWFKGQPVDHLHPFGTELAKGCQGCAGSNFDNPHSFMPLHVIGVDRSRESDLRLDWQGELMYGRLPYNSAGLLQLGPDSKDIIECNSRCKCGPKCKNRELQKGLRCHLELFKTEDRGWGVRTLEQIPRGRFVVEYVGDVITQAEADERGEKYDQNQLSYLFNLDHPEVPHSDAIVLDGITMSNIARFINHSCEGNLMIFRVFSETTDLRYFRIGMFAIQDIEVGDELSYDYNYALSKDASEVVDDPTAIRCFCGTPSCRKWLWQGGESGLKH